MLAASTAIGSAEAGDAEEMAAGDRSFPVAPQLLDEFLTRIHEVSPVSVATGCLDKPAIPAVAAGSPIPLPSPPAAPPDGA